MKEILEKVMAILKCEQIFLLSDCYVVDHAGKLGAVDLNGTNRRELNGPELVEFLKKYEDEINVQYELVCNKYNIKSEDNLKRAM